MFEWIKLFPPYLILLTIVFVILPTVIVTLIRISLYKYLQDSAEKVKRLITGSSRGRQPAIVDKVEARFKNASSQLESVNTAALIEGIYSEEDFTFLSWSLRCEQWDHFSRILPNLLLAFGLLGTFLGITLNLTNISEIIHQGGVNDSNLVQNLQIPLQSMGIAFITSLIALLCSSVLTVINLHHNTSLAKNKLINYLEDYLDNIFHPTIDGHTRLDKAVNRMVEQQNEFLTRFHENVTRAVESSLGRVAQQIADGNIEAASLAKQVYERLTETSGTLARGSDTFLSSTLLLEKHINSLNEIVQHKNFVEYAQTLNFAVQAFLRASEKIEESQFANKLAAATADLVISHNQFAESTSVLNQSTQSIESAIQDFQKSIQWMVDLGEEISLVNQQSSELLSANQKQIVLEEESFKKIQSELVELVETVKISQEQANYEVRTLGNSIVSNISNLLGSNSDNLQQVSQTIEQSASHLKESQQGLSQMLANVNNNTKGLNSSLQYVQDIPQILTELVELVETVKISQEQANYEVRTLGNSIVSNISNLLGSNSDNLQQVSQTIEQSASHLKESQQGLSQMLANVNNNTKGLNSSLQYVQDIPQILKNLIKQIDNVREIRIILSRLLEEQQKNISHHNSRQDSYRQNL